MLSRFSKNCQERLENPLKQAWALEGQWLPAAQPLTHLLPAGFLLGRPLGPGPASFPPFLLGLASSTKLELPWMATGLHIPQSEDNKKINTIKSGNDNWRVATVLRWKGRLVVAGPLGAPWAPLTPLTQVKEGAETQLVLSRGLGQSHLSFALVIMS